MTKMDDRLASLRKSISDMTDEELEAELKITRNNRRPSPAKRKAKAQATKTKKTKKKVDNALGDLTPEQAAALLAQLTGGNNE